MIGVLTIMKKIKVVNFGQTGINVPYIFSKKNNLIFVNENYLKNKNITCQEIELKISKPLNL